jgi:hypothetical protein
MKLKKKTKQKSKKKKKKSKTIQWIILYEYSYNDVAIPFIALLINL